MRYILGMAKSNLDLNGAKSPKLELDYLRLVFAVKELRRRGDSVQGYLVVLTPDIADRVKQWERKYLGKDCVKVVTPPLPVHVKNKLKEEKVSNVAGMLAGATGGESSGRSSADFSRDTAENALKRTILKSEPNVHQVIDQNTYPFGIRWDFYGVAD